MVGRERQLLTLLRRHRVTGWVANAELMIGSLRCYPDVLFKDARIIVEFDGYAVHSQPEVFESDRRRQNLLVLAGYGVLRYTWTQLNEQPEVVIAQLRTLLARDITSESAPLPGGEAAGPSSRT